MLLQRRGALINVTGDATALSTAAPHISSFLSALPAEAGAPSDWRSTLPQQNEALIVPTQVSRRSPVHRRYASSFAARRSELTSWNFCCQ